MNSPIEKMLLGALIDAAPESAHLLDSSHLGGASLHRDNNDASLFVIDIQDYPATVYVSDYGGFWFGIYADVRVSSYRVDILLSADANGSNGPFLAVECDGHDFHERTKQQASQDRARDRELLLLGIPTIRFTGSDIHRDAFACAIECWSIVRKLRNAVDAEQDIFSRGWNGGIKYEQERHPDHIEEHW